jgi:hypothetical protein
MARTRRRIASLSIAVGLALTAGTAILLTGIGPAGAFTPGEGTGSGWCARYAGTSLGSYHDVYACKPDSKTAGKTPFDSYAGFQPTELANRYLYAVTGHTLFDNDVAGNFVALASASFALAQATSGASAGLPAAGDIISMWGGRSKQRENGDHTQVAIVTAVSAGTAGWIITTLNQGDPSDTDGRRGFDTIAVSRNRKTWSALNGFYADFGWLRLGHAKPAPAPPPATWQAVQAPGNGSAPGRSLTAVACATTASCAAVGTASGSAVLIARTGPVWTPVTVPTPASATTATSLTAVTCPAATTCLAAGSYRSAGRQQGLLVSGHGSMWTATTAPLPGNAAASPQARITAVACASGSSCVAVGQYATGTSRAALLVAGHGSAWSAGPAPLPADASSRPAAGLVSVACPSATVCTAVGSYVDKLGNRQGLLTVLHGTSWSAVRAPLPAGASVPGAVLSAVACPTVTRCVAIGSYSAASRGFAVSGAGTSWAAARTPQPAGAAASPAVTFRAIACPAGACVAVGSYLDSAGSRHGLVVTGQGSAFTAARAALPAGAAPAQGSPGAQLASVACPSAAACVAVGSYTDTAGEAQVLLLTLGGSTWTAMRAPNPADARTVGSQAQGTLAPPALSSVACPGAGQCVAVGSYPARKLGMTGLILTGRT